MCGYSAEGRRNDYSAPVSSRTASASNGSRTAAYFVAGAFGTVPVFFVLALFLGFYGAVGGVVVVWTTGIVWLLRKRQEDPTWEHRPPAGQR